MVMDSGLCQFLLKGSLQKSQGEQFEVCGRVNPQAEETTIDS